MRDRNKEPVSDSVQKTKNRPKNRPFFVLWRWEGNPEVKEGRFSFLFSDRKKHFKKLRDAENHTTSGRPWTLGADKVDWKWYIYGPDGELVDKEEDKDAICECGRTPEDCATYDGADEHEDR